MRYSPVKSRESNNASMSAIMKNTKEIDSKELKKDGVPVLTEDIITGDENEKDTTKIPSLYVIKKILDNYSTKNENDLSKNVSLLSDIQNLKKEYNEVNAKTDVLLDISVTPELIGIEIRNTITNDLTRYVDSYMALSSYMSELIEKNNVTDSNYTVFNTLVDIYTQNFAKISKTIQLATQTVMTLKSNNVLEIANNNINEIASQLTYKLEIYSSNGPFFREGSVDTDLSVKVFKGKSEVTDDFKELQYRWSRKSSNEDKDEIWGMNARRGKKIHIGNSDYEKGGCSFVCTLYDELGRKLVSSID